MTHISIPVIIETYRMEGPSDTNREIRRVFFDFLRGSKNVQRRISVSILATIGIWRLRISSFLLGKDPDRGALDVYRRAWDDRGYL